MKSRTFRALVKNGSITDVLWKNICEYIKGFDDKQIKIVVEEYQPVRSKSQNAFWWKVIVPLVRAWFMEQGIVFSADDTHSFIVSQVWRDTEIIEIDGKPYERRLSSTKLTTKEWSDRMEITYQYFSEKGLVLPLPEKAVPDYLAGPLPLP